MATLDAICQAMANTIAVKIKENGGLQLYPYAGLPDQFNYPAVAVEPDNADWGLTFGGKTDQHVLRVFVLCSTSPDMLLGQRQLMQLLSGSGPNSIRLVLHEHGDLGLPGTTSTPLGFGGYGGSFEAGQVRSVGAIIQVRVMSDADGYDPFN